MLRKPVSVKVGLEALSLSFNECWRLLRFCRLLATLTADALIAARTSRTRRLLLSAKTMSIGAKKKRPGDFAARCMDVDVDVQAGRDRARNVYTLYDDSVARSLLGDRSKRRAKSRGVLAGVTVLDSFGSICRLLYSYRLNEKVTRHLPP